MFTNRVNIGYTKYWNPWIGCKKISPACQHCFIGQFNKVERFQLNPPLLLDSPKGQVIITCLESDFFIEEADDFRQEAWDAIKKHPEQIFLIITKRVERIQQCLPKDWGDGYENVVLSLTVETQELVDYRIPLFLSIPCKHKWLSCCPLIEPLDISKYLTDSQIEFVETCGEMGCDNVIRPTYYEWVKQLSDQCKNANVRFSFMKLGQKFIKDGQQLSEKSGCYHSPLADSQNLDIGIPLEFILNGKEYIIH